MPTIDTIKKKLRRRKKALIKQGMSDTEAQIQANAEMNKKHGHGWRNVGSGDFWHSAKTTP